MAAPPNDPVFNTRFLGYKRRDMRRRNTTSPGGSARNCVLSVGARAALPGVEGDSPRTTDVRSKRAKRNKSSPSRIVPTPPDVALVLG